MSEFSGPGPGTVSDTEQVIRDGREATRILDSDVFRGAVQQVKDAIQQRWMEATEVETREKAHAYMTALESVVVQLETVMQGGEVEQELLRRQEAQR